MAEKLTIQFNAVGGGALKKTLEDLHLANVKLTKGNKAFVREQKKLAKNLKKSNKEWVHYHRNVGKAGGITSKFGIAMSSIRSKLLIYAFAVGLVTLAMRKLLDAFIEQEAAEKKLEVALGKTSQALLNQASALQQVTTFGDEAIIGVQALVASFTDDEEAIKAATKATLDLAAAKGMDLNAAADLVSKTLGSTTNSLSRYGIEVTGAVGSTGRLNSLTKNIADLFGGQATAATQTLGGAMQQMSNAFGDANEAVGKAFAPTLMKLAHILKENAEAAREWILGFSEDPLERTARRIEEAGGNADRLRLSMAQFAQIDLNEKAAKFPEFLNTSVEAIDKLEFKQGEFVNALNRQSEVERTIHNQGIDISLLRAGQVGNLDTLIKGLEEQLKLENSLGESAEFESDFHQETTNASADKLKILIEETKITRDNLAYWKGILDGAEKNVKLADDQKTKYEDIVKFLLEYEAGLLTIEQLQKKINGETDKTTKTLTEWIKLNKDAIDSVMDSANIVSDIFSELSSRAKEEAQDRLESIRELANAELEIAKSVTKGIIDDKKKTRAWERMSAKAQAKFEATEMAKLAHQEAIINAGKEAKEAQATKKANELMKVQFRITQGIKIAEAVMNTANAYTAALKLSPIYAAFVAGLGAAQVAMIASQQPPKMAEGGLIGGRPHSQGGTMINAERGEFVMSRGAVNAIGTETLNRLNQGGGSSNIVINFSGNVLSQDFIEEEALPQIKEALRRGGDIGIG